MSKYSFEIKSSQDLLKKLLEDFAEFKNNQSSSRIAINCAMTAWHLTDWVYEEYNATLGFGGKREFRTSLRCESLNVMHDIANGAKHLKLSDPKSAIIDSRVYEGDFSLEDFAREDFKVSRLELIMSNGELVDFYTELEKTVEFWQDYLSSIVKS